MKFFKGVSKKKIVAFALILICLATVAVLFATGLVRFKYKAATGGCTWQKPGVKVIPAGDYMSYILPGATMHLAVSLKSGGVGADCPTHRFALNWSGDLPVGWNSTITPNPVQIPAYIPFTGADYPGDYYGTRLVDLDIATSSD